MQVDQILKDFWEDNDRFADFFNTVFFGGENVIAPEELETLSPEVSAAEETKQGLEGQTKYRDKVKRWKGVKLAVLGIENQDRIHYAMPERTLLYEALQYEAQRKEAASRHRKQKDLRGSEYLSGFARTDRLSPVLTAVIYYGEEPWDGPTSLGEMVDLPEEMRASFQDYRMHLFQVLGNDGRDFKNEDIRTVLRNADALRKGKISRLDEKIDAELVKYVAAFVNSERVMKLAGKRKRKEGVPMCTALEELIKERENCGKAEGRAEGKAESVLELLEELGEVPKCVLDRIMGERDLETLRRWHKEAAHAGSVREFLERMEKQG